MPLQIIRQDITKMQVDAIVNPTNEEMVGYGGVDFAVHQAAGPRLDAACRALAPLVQGEAKITLGYALPCRYVIHTVGPIWEGGSKGEAAILRSCYRESLKLALLQGVESVAFPLISSGTYGFPKDRVLRFAVEVITEFLYEHELTVYLCVFDRQSYSYSKALFDDIASFLDEGAVVERMETYSVASARPFPPFMPRCERSAPPPPAIESRSLADYMKEKDKSFAYKLFDYIDGRGVTDVACYKKANVDKKTFSKIKCNPDTYKPSKQTAVAFAVALELTLEETQDLLASAGMTLSHSMTFDRIILYFIQKKIYDVFEINQALFEFDQLLLGNVEK